MWEEHKVANCKKATGVSFVNPSVIVCFAP